MDPTAIFDGHAQSIGTIEVKTRRAGVIKVIETTLDIRGSVVTDRPGDEPVVELENFPVMVTTRSVADAFTRHAETGEFTCALISLEDGMLRLIAISDNSHVYMDGDETILDDDMFEFLDMAA